MHRNQTLAALAALALSLVLVPVAWAGSNPELVEAQRQYRQERSVCLAGKSPQDRGTCLREAGAAYMESRRGALADAAGTDLQQNAVRRCDAQPPADRPACVQRILGAASTQGSVEGGGLIRETETRVP